MNHIIKCISAKTIKLVQENIGVKLHDLGLVKTPKAKVNKTKEERELIGFKILKNHFWLPEPLKQ